MITIVLARGQRIGIAVAAALLCMLPPLAVAQSQTTLSEQVRVIAQLDREGNYSEAFELLLTALAHNRNDYDVNCWMAEILVDSSELAARSAMRDTALLLAEEAVAHARVAINARPRGAEGWFQVGQSLGALSRLAGGAESVGAARESKAAFEKAISIDSSHAGALHGLARWHTSVAGLSTAERIGARVLFGGLPPASNDEAIKLFRRAIAIEPEKLIHRLGLAMTYADLGQDSLARIHLETAIRLPEASHWDVARREQALRLLDSLKIERRP